MGLLSSIFIGPASFVAHHFAMHNASHMRRAAGAKRKHDEQLTVLV
jgi:hypothetical protein